MAACNITAVDVANAIRNQNLDAPAGWIGQPPNNASQAFELPIDTLGRLNTPEQFGEIIVKVGMSAPPPSPQHGQGSAAQGQFRPARTPRPPHRSVGHGIRRGQPAAARRAVPRRPTMPVGDGTTGGTATGGVTTGGGATTGGGGNRGRRRLDRGRWDDGRCSRRGSRGNDRRRSA